MGTLLEKTFLKVDVLTVDVCFDAATAERFAAIASAGRLTGAAADSIARAALAGRLAIGRIQFVRSVSLDQFIEGIAEDQRKAVRAGFLPDSVFRAISRGLPVWFAFLEERGIRKGDQLLYELESESIRTVFVGADGKVLLDQTDPGRERRNSVLATWLAPGSSFRPGLLRSLQREGRRAGGAAPLAARCRLAGRPARQP